MTTLCGRWIVALIGVMVGAAFPLPGQETSPTGTATSFTGAQWIWTDSGYDGDLNTLPASVGYFRAEVSIPESPALESAEIIVTCDNLFVLYLNGLPVGESRADNSAWQSPKRWDLSDMIAPGRSVLAIEAVNTLPGPAGLMVRFTARLADGQTIERLSDGSWKTNRVEARNWSQPDFDDQKWSAAAVVAQYGDTPWGLIQLPERPVPGGEPIGKVREVLVQDLLLGRVGGGGPVVEVTPDSDFEWPEAIAFVGDDCSLYRPRTTGGTADDSLTVTVFNPRNATAYPEHDLPAPMKVGRRLYRLAPVKADTEPEIIIDAGKTGALGSPSTSWDGQRVFVSMAREGESFFHIYVQPLDGSPARRLTDGPFHDIDPAQLPDGRIVFTSTRIGTWEEYHSPPSRALFLMEADGAHIRPLTHTIIFDNEPEVLTDGRIIFLRSDNFFDRGKVETNIHSVFPDGTSGLTEFGLDNGPEYGNRLRAFVCGGPTAMPDGRVAFVSAPGITIGRPGAASGNLNHYAFPAGDVAALTDGRLLCTTPKSVKREEQREGKVRVVEDRVYGKIGVLDPNALSPSLTIVYESTENGLHSPISLAPRARPLELTARSHAQTTNGVDETGYLYCQDVFFTQHSTAGWSNVRAIRLLAGIGLTVRSGHSYIVHAGNETVDLGTIPLAPDGSFYIEAPANTPLALQAVDAEGRSELNEMSWIYLKPGETRGCVGCHPKRQRAPKSEAAPLLATKVRPLQLLGQGDPHRFRGNNAAVTGLMELQFDRFREVAGLNRHDDLSQGVQDDMKVLFEQLRGNTSDLKISAAQRLAIYRDRAAEPALIAALDDFVAEARVAAALALSACGTRNAWEALADCLDDPDAWVAQAAAVALENLTGHAAPFNAFAPKGKRGAEAWRLWIANTTPSEREATLIVRLASAERDTVRRAAVALGHTSGPAGAEALRKLVDRSRHNNPFPEWRKSHQGDNARFNALSEVNPRALQAATRALGWLGDEQSIPLLAEIITDHGHPDTGNLFLLEAAVEALGRIATPEAESILIRAFSRWDAYPKYTYWYGDHEALMSCHASPAHYGILEALDRMGTSHAETITTHLIQSVPIDPDRALFLPNDDYETLTGRLIRNQGQEDVVVSTCLAFLGDQDAEKTPEVQQALETVYRCWGGDPNIEIRAAQILSLACRNPKYEPAIRAAFDRYRQQENTIQRVFHTGIPVVDALPVKNWVCFYLARSLGNLGLPESLPSLTACLDSHLAEAASGHPDPLGPGVLFVHNDLTPCWRAAAAWALGEIGDPQSAPVLLNVIANMENATDTRHSAVKALSKINTADHHATIRQMAEDYPEISTRQALLRLAQTN